MDKEKEVVEQQEQETAEKADIKAEVQEKIQKRIERNREKNDKMGGVARVTEYLKTEHKWENYLFVAISIITLLLGALILSGVLVVRENFPLIGKYPTAFAWVLMAIAFIGLIYALYPFFKPAFPEFKKITWLTKAKFIGNIIRTFLFMIILVLLFLLYDSFITRFLQLILK